MNVQDPFNTVAFICGTAICMVAEPHELKSVLTAEVIELGRAMFVAFGTGAASVIAKMMFEKIGGYAIGKKEEK